MGILFLFHLGSAEEETRSECAKRGARSRSERRQKRSGGAFLTRALLKCYTTFKNRHIIEHRRFGRTANAWGCYQNQRYRQHLNAGPILQVLSDFILYTIYKYAFTLFHLNTAGACPLGQLLLFVYCYKGLFFPKRGRLCYCTKVRINTVL